MAKDEKPKPIQTVGKVSSPEGLDPNATGMFRWYQDLFDRILPKKKTGR